MNQRIKQLVEQALKHPDTDNDGLTVFDNDELEKFAELIVKECAGISEQHNRNYYTSHGQIIADKIKEHFGVK